MVLTTDVTGKQFLRVSGTGRGVTQHARAWITCPFAGAPALAVRAHETETPSRPCEE